MKCMSAMCPDHDRARTARTATRQSGFSLVTAIFILVILAGLGAFMMNISSVQHTTSALDVQGARAYQAARAGIEWGAYQALKNPAYACTPAAAPPSSGTSSDTINNFTGDLAGFTTTVTCNSTAVTEGVNTVITYALVSVATSGTAGSVDYVRRDVQATISR